MIVRELTQKDKPQVNKTAHHPTQSWAWGEFRTQTGVGVRRFGVFENQKLKSSYQVTIHPVPKTNLTIGYFPRGEMPDENMIKVLKKVGQEENCIFIKLEPNVASKAKEKRPSSWQKIDSFLAQNNCKKAKEILPRYTIQVDLKKPESDLLGQMKSKTRYNVRLAKRKGVKVIQDSTKQGFQDYLDLRAKTLKRQGFYDHTEEYKRKMWQHLKPEGVAHLLKAVYQNQVLAAWIFFTFDQKLYYPYGASSSKHREVMASNLLMWEGMRFGKKQNCNTFDMWGSLGPRPNKKDPWYGFHRFKTGFGGQIMEFIGSYDLVLKPLIYPAYRLADWARWQMLKLKK